SSPVTAIQLSSRSQNPVRNSRSARRRRSAGKPGQSKGKGQANTTRIAYLQAVRSREGPNAPSAATLVISANAPIQARKTATTGRARMARRTHTGASNGRAGVVVSVDIVVLHGMRVDAAAELSPSLVRELRLGAWKRATGVRQRQNLGSPYTLRAWG